MSLLVLRYRSLSSSGMPPDAAVKTETVTACPFAVLQTFVRSRQVRITHLQEYPHTPCLYDMIILRCLGCYYLSALIVTTYSTGVGRPPTCYPPPSTAHPHRYLSLTLPSHKPPPQSQAPDSPVTNLGFPDLPCQSIRYLMGGRYINQHAFLLSRRPASLEISWTCLLIITKHRITILVPQRVNPLWPAPSSHPILQTIQPKRTSLVIVRLNLAFTFEMEIHAICLSHAVRRRNTSGSFMASRTWPAGLRLCVSGKIVDEAALSDTISYGTFVKSIWITIGKKKTGIEF
ncbi:hypothetical protein EDD15DRAFT_876395 [Pisolithus albus]|nr:hypothetical protein EDD15DRAFT_876395 [Pisolithus albus]